MLLTEEKRKKIAKDTHIFLLQKGRAVYLKTSGPSMFPFMKSGDTVRIAPPDKENIRIGDIIAVNVDEKENAWFCAHRLVKIISDNGKKIYITKGDTHRRMTDKPASFEDIAGKITQIKRGDLVMNLEKPGWRFLNPIIAYISLKYPGGLYKMRFCTSLVIEWKRFPQKVIRRFTRRTPFAENAEELLLICARSNPGKSLTEKAKKIIQKGIDWSHFKDIVMKNAPAFLLYNSLGKMDCLADIPSNIRESLKSGYFLAVRTATVRYRQTIEVLKLFSEKGIPVIPLKGPILSKRLYGDIASRGASTDIDLLIEGENIKKAGKLLEGAGYKFDPRGKKTDLLWTHHFVKENNPTIDLHWEITPATLNDKRMIEFWKGTKVAEEEGARFHEFRKEELLLYISANLVDSTHLTELRPACDINALLTEYKDSLDWERIIKKVKKLKLSSSLYMSLYLSQKLFGSYVPDAILAKLRPGIAKRIFIRTFADKRVILHKNSRRRHFMKGFLRYLVFQVLEAQSTKEYFRIFFPPKEKMKGKSYFRRLTRGMGKFAEGLKTTGISK